MELESAKLEFLKSQIFSLTISAAFRQGRGNPVYNKKIVTENFKKKFYVFLMNKLEGYEFIYKGGVEGGKHIENIEGLQTEINKEYGHILYKNNISFGRVQKLINLYLKYLWTLGRIPVPPHCPFDSIIISELKAGVPPWTKQSFKKEDYGKLVGLAKNKSKNIAEWELKFWNGYLKKRGEVL